ncbi:two-component regulatory system response regulator PhoB [Erysipelotrichaceae bacterium]|nr:two-component regulatory system response regulator PhoB [Erysipelotrichaceae bacterium]
MNQKILLVEDNQNIAKILIYDLEQAGFTITHCLDGETALEKMATENFIIYLLDWMLPGISGLHLCAKIRKTSPEVHIIMLTARGEEFDKIEAFSHGADDYLTKPFSTRELIARIKAYLRKNPVERAISPLKISYEDLVIDMETRVVLIHMTPLKLTKKEYDLLSYFVQNPLKVFTREHLLSTIWGYHYDGGNRTVDVHIFKLRSKLELHSKLTLRTIRGVGYALSLRADADSEISGDA